MDGITKLRESYVAPLPSVVWVGFGSPSPWGNSAKCHFFRRVEDYITNQLRLSLGPQWLLYKNLLEGDIHDPAPSTTQDRYILNFARKLEWAIRGLLKR